MLTEPINADNVAELMPDKIKIQFIVENIDKVYKQIKKCEESPNTDYLFSGIEKQSLFDQSIRRMELVNSMDSALKTTK